MRLRIEFEIEGELAETLDGQLALSDAEIEEVMRALVDLYCGMSPMARMRLLDIAEHPDWMVRTLPYRSAGMALTEAADRLQL